MPRAELDEAKHWMDLWQAAGRERGKRPTHAPRRLTGGCLLNPICLVCSPDPQPAWRLARSGYSWRCGRGGLKQTGFFHNAHSPLRVLLPLLPTHHPPPISAFVVSGGVKLSSSLTASEPQPGSQPVAAVGCCPCPVRCHRGVLCGVGGAWLASSSCRCYCCCQSLSLLAVVVVRAAPSAAAAAPTAQRWPDDG